MQFVSFFTELIVKSSLAEELVYCHEIVSSVLCSMLIVDIYQLFVCTVDRCGVRERGGVKARGEISIARIALMIDRTNEHLY